MKSKSVQEWITELQAAKKREDKYRSSSRKITKLYEADRSTVSSGIESNSGTPFNILYSNTETLAPALYNSQPKPKVNRRFLDKDPMGAEASELTQRLLGYLLDNEGVGYETFDALMESAVTQALVPGRGVIRVKYEAEAPAGKAVDEVVEEEEEKSGGAGETVALELIPWDHFLHGYARSWGSVPWVSFLHFMSKDEVRENFGPEAAARIPFSESSDAGEGEGESEGEKVPGLCPVTVYEIWDKHTKTVYFVTEGYPEFLKKVEDPLNLVGFFPMPRPLMFFRRISSLLPTSPYTFYEDQARELNQVTVRIRRIVAALKVRGFYDSTIEGIEKLLSAEDNTFLPAQNIAALPQGQSLDKALFLVPIEKLVTVVQQLYIQRQQIKQVIYDITGIADIMRGSSQASETLGAQEIKTQWGTLRLKKSQKEVARFARDLLRIMAEVAVTRFAPETLLGMTGLQFPTMVQKQQMMLQAQMQAQQAMMQNPGAPPPPMPELPPSIEELQSLLQSDLLRSFRIDIETNSTVELEATQDKQEMAELMNAIAQFINGIAPAVGQGLIPFEVAKGMLLGIVRRYRFGADIEKGLETMQPPQPPPPDAKNSPEVVQAETEAYKVKAQTDLQVAQQEMQLKKMEHDLKVEELKLKQQMMIMKHQMDMQKMQMQEVVARSKPAGLSGNNSGGKSTNKSSSE